MSIENVITKPNALRAFSMFIPPFIKALSKPAPRKLISKSLTLSIHNSSIPYLTGLST